MTLDLIDRSSRAESTWRSVATTRPETLQQAWRLAMTGQYADWRAVAGQLRVLGRLEADGLLREPRVRAAMNRVCAEAAEDAHLFASLTAPTGPVAIPGETDEAAIWRTIEEEHRAYWSRNAAWDAAYHVRAGHELLWAWSAGTGVTVRRGWMEIEAGLSDSITSMPEPSPFFALRVKRRNRSTRIRGEVAWVTFEEIYPTDDLPGFRGASGSIQELRILEREAGVWKIAFIGILDEHAGQTATPIWQVDRDGRVLWQNAAALAYISPDTELQLRAGRLRMGNGEMDTRFRRALSATAEPDGCLLAGSDLTPVVFDPGDGRPVRVWWVQARSGKLFVSVNDQELFSRRLSLAASALRLTPAQQRLIFSIASGHTLESAARQEGVRLSTARTQLQRTYDKVGVRSQAALIRALIEATEP